MDKKNNLTKGSRIYLLILSFLFAVVAYTQYFHLVHSQEYIIDIIVAFIKLFFGAFIISAFLSFPFKGKRVQVIFFNTVLTVLFLVLSWQAVEKKLEILDGITAFDQSMMTFVSKAEENAAAPWLASFTAVQELFPNIQTLDSAMVTAYKEKVDIYQDETNNYIQYFEGLPELVEDEVSGNYSVSNKYKSTFQKDFDEGFTEKKPIFLEMMQVHYSRGEAIKILLTFLSDNEKDWSTDGTNIMFESDEQVDRYGKLIDVIVKLDEKLEVKAKAFSE